MPFLPREVPLVSSPLWNRLKATLIFAFNEQRAARPGATSTSTWTTSGSRPGGQRLWERQLSKTGPTSL
jgi:hypothetical protein